MSDGKIELQRARAIAESFITLIADCCEHVEICGSVRRGKLLVGDIEIVVIPDPKKNLMVRLDNLVVRGLAQRALYGNTVRWGSLYRGVMYKRAKVEIFVADGDNLGYIRALRTGPGDANTLLMTHMKKRRWNVRFSEGYGWQVEYPSGESDAFKRVSKLRVMDEATFFRLAGLPHKPVMLPGARDVDVYAHLLEKSMMPDEAFLKSLYVRAAPVQREMF